MDFRHLGIPFVVYDQGDSRNLRTPYHDDVLPREFAEQHLPDSRGSNSNRNRPQSSRNKATTQGRSWLDDDTAPRKDSVAPATLVTAPRYSRHPRLVPMEFVFKELEAHLKDSHTFYASYKTAYTNMTQHLDGIASVSSMEMLWKDLLQKKFENTREKNKFVTAAAKISQTIEEASMVAGVSNALDRDAAAQLAYERNLRKVNKLRVISGDITKLAKWALTELAIDDLLDEINAAIRVLQSEPVGKKPAHREGNDNNGDRGHNDNYGDYGNTNQDNGGMSTTNQQDNDGDVPQQSGWTSN
ncbi:hypothetical protein UCRPA7_5945 [Phaeoacremonium minimum UCRPA7]|uniref:Uncharacterized protein n=1 Tax=Phaeoacremonium minimum (strain UCR-PA7) TaxID=1286976 RepID=R8BH06_PHAM7|nr:hypothetical protein UCRPA7_5945 [Phaeoacremonium minimum UCRPA7]EON98596.1 hypothetical protein UCRPA7_5945 [Phaeoacremonium minimum UCRPA7]